MEKNASPGCAAIAMMLDGVAGFCPDSAAAGRPGICDALLSRSAVAKPVAARPMDWMSFRRLSMSMLLLIRRILRREGGESCNTNLDSFGGRTSPVRRRRRNLYTPVGGRRQEALSPRRF